MTEEAETGVPVTWKHPFPLFMRPIQRQRWNDTQIHPVVNWGDLFFDLFYVAAAYNVGNIILSAPSSEGFLYFVGCFWAVMYMWLDKMHYDSRFYTHDDVYHRVFEVAVLVVLATAVLHIRPVEFLSTPSNHVDMFAFCLACFLGNLLTIVRYLEICFWVEGEEAAKMAAWRDIRSKLLPTAFYVAAMAVAAAEYYGNMDGTDYPYKEANTTAYGAQDESHRSLAETTEETYADSYDTTNVPIWLVCAASLTNIIWLTLQITVFFPGGGAHKLIAVPMNIQFVIHRYGEWTMLMLGESILSLLIVDISGGYDYYGTFYTGILSVILLQYLHFRSQPHHADEHAMRRKKEAGVAFSILMQIYSAALILLGVSYKMFLFEYVFEDAGSHRMMTEQGAGTRRMFFAVPRGLAGGGAAALQYETDDRQQRIAYFFCGCMAVVWLTCDLMIIVHRGLKDNLNRCYCEHTHKARSLAITLIVSRVGLIVFIATLSLYVTDPLVLPVTGLCCIFVQLILRVISGVVFPDDGVHSEVDEHGDHVEVEDDEDENKWPNTTQAQAVPGNQVDAEDVTTSSEVEHHAISRRKSEVKIQDISRRKSDYQVASDECYCVAV